ncbi:hypothetical protein [Piscirickettsia litoralis]|uniref:Uncharacterized protein n=1 Tax=Piscirickettsia litoralis TaxID=1891921 RepID=A0ABX2ZZS3_9GAMM|nr:hypothetical protein [Piscirickettsia litoralis]ODN41889.1 hypothetical protein BGC07_01550 [Piscirickettsia litoralis]
MPIPVVMNSGEVRRSGSHDTLATGRNSEFNENLCSFGGCMAIYAVSEDLYGLFHLQLTDRNKQELGNWLHKIKEFSAASKISFFIGKPHPSGRYPETSTKGCLERRCKEEGIDHFDVTIMDMAGVTYVEASKDGMLLTDISGRVIKHKTSKYQCDKDYILNEYPQVDYNNLVKDDPDIGEPILDSASTNKTPLLLQQKYEQSEAAKGKESTTCSPCNIL